MITPNSKIILLKSPIELDNNNQLTFSNANSQYSYFYNLPKKVLEEATFQRKDNVLRFETNETDFTFDDVLLYNYCMYQNTSYGDKWFYAFIVNCTYLNNGAVAIELKTDVFQTWQFDITWKQSFVEREHIAKSADVAGANTIPENVELGEYSNITNVDMSYTSFNYCVAVSEDILRSDETIYHNKYNGIISGLTYIVLQDEADVNYFIFRYNQAGKINAIMSLFMIPNGYVGAGNYSTDATGLIHYKYISSSNTTFELGDVTITKPTIIGESGNGYTPVNKKLLTFPYIALVADNNAGTNVVYHFEDFTAIEGSPANRITFNAYGTISAGCNIKIVPRNYKHIAYNYNESFNGAKIPIASWTNDVYTNWLTQNGVNIGVGIAGSLVSTATGFATANAIGTSSGILGIAQSIGTIYEHSIIPNQVEGNITSSDTMFSLGKIAPTFYIRSIKVEYARIIDNYFAMYGYKTNLLKIPNTNNRSNWNYVKTINANLIGDIPQNDMQEIKQMFDNGITLWHNATHFLDYSQSNN